MARNLAPSATTLNWVEKKLTSPAGGPMVAVTVAAAVAAGSVAAGVSVTSTASVGVASTGASVGSSVGAGVAVAPPPQAVKSKAAMSRDVNRVLILFILFFSF